MRTPIHSEKPALIPSYMEGHFLIINPFAPEFKMARSFITLTFVSVDEILSCYYSNQTSLVKRLHSTIYYFVEIFQRVI